MLSESRQILAPISTAAQSAEAQQILDEAIAEAASVDGDRVLDQFEAEAIKLAFEAVAPQDGSPITADVAADMKSALLTRLGEMKAEQVKSTEVLFTSEGEALKSFRGKIMGAMKDTIKKAAGKKVDINLMLFSFTDKIMADEIIKMAEDNPNVTFRLLTDWTQLSSSASRQPPRIAKLVEKNQIPNIIVKFKKDNPYVWDSNNNRPRFSHGHTKGLNHHKGFVTLIDGRPEKMSMGSFNWSVSAMKSNYENMMMLDRKDPDNRRIMKGYQKEFEGFWNRDDSALLYGEARKEKNRIYEEMYEAHGQSYTGFNVADDTIADPVYTALDNSTAFDINSFSDGDTADLEALVGKTMASRIHKELREYGRFDSWTEVLARVPSTASLDTWTREQLMENLEFGDGGVSINTATVEELDRAGVSRSQAEKIVKFREEHGAFESLAELDNVSGIGPSTIERVSATFTDDGVVGTYSARVPGAAAATTGWASEHHGHMSVPKTPDDGTVDGAIAANRAQLEDIERTLAAPVIDMLRRTKPGETFRIAMYGMSTSSDEFKALEQAVARGVKLRVVIYKSYNAGAIDKLDELKGDGFDVDLRVVKSRVMHEKFGVRGDDVFNGSSNWSSSSITKHSEDRFLFRNEPDLADRFVEEFDRLWNKGNPPS
jgi:competence ComEA-like helix-hairpin-helix protein